MRRPSIVVTKELGYPMVFVEYAERGNCSDYFFAQVKETMFTNPFMPSEEVYKKTRLPTTPRPGSSPIGSIRAICATPPTGSVWWTVSDVIVGPDTLRTSAPS